MQWEVLWMYYFIPKFGFFYILSQEQVELVLNPGDNSNFLELVTDDNCEKKK